MDGALELATRLAQGPTQSYSLIKYLVHQSMELSLKESIELAHVAQDTPAPPRTTRRRSRPS